MEDPFLYANENFAHQGNSDEMVAGNDSSLQKIIIKYEGKYQSAAIIGKKRCGLCEDELPSSVLEPPKVGINSYKKAYLSLEEIS